MVGGWGEGREDAIKDAFEGVVAGSGQIESSVDEKKAGFAI